MEPSDELKIGKAVEILASAEALVITAGAGMGVDSGLPDFRGNEGFWKAYPIAAKRGLAFEDLANPHWFDRDPQLAWAFYGHRLNLYRETVPHAGFRLLKTYAETLKGGAFVVTSNVDGQFQKAGFDESAVAECHGSIHHFQCAAPCGRGLWPGVDEVKVDMEKFLAEKPLPQCPNCRGIARPNILMFGDWNWVPTRTTEQESRLAKWLDEVRFRNLRCAVIKVGAGTAIPTIRRRSENFAREFGGRFVRINVRESQANGFGIGLAMSAREGIERLVHGLPAA